MNADLPDLTGSGSVCNGDGTAAAAAVVIEQDEENEEESDHGQNCKNKNTTNIVRHKTKNRCQGKFFYYKCELSIRHLDVECM